MREFDKNKHMVKNREAYLKAANEGIPADKVWARVVANRLICGAVGIALIAIPIIAALTD